MCQMNDLSQKKRDFKLLCIEDYVDLLSLKYSKGCVRPVRRACLHLVKSNKYKFKKYNKIAKVKGLCFLHRNFSFAKCKTLL